MSEVQGPIAASSVETVEVPEQAAEFEPAGAPDDGPLSLVRRVEQLEAVCEALAERVQAIEARLQQVGTQVEGCQQVLESLRRQAAVQHESEASDSHSAGWLVGEMWSDVWLLVRMFRDARYRVAWTTALIVAGALVYLTIWPAIRQWLGWSWNLPVISYFDNLLVAYLGLKVLSRELRRYELFLKQRRQ